MQCKLAAGETYMFVTSGTLEGKGTKMLHYDVRLETELAFCFVSEGARTVAEVSKICKVFTIFTIIKRSRGENENEKKGRTQLRGSMMTMITNVTRKERMLAATKLRKKWFDSLGHN